MTDTAPAKAHELREMAREFRQKVSETCLAAYVDLMTRTAEELEQLADHLEQTSSEYANRFAASQEGKHYN